MLQSSQKSEISPPPALNLRIPDIPTMAPLGRDYKRPENIPFPTTWRRFRGKKPMPGGLIPEFWIQDATEDMAEEIADHFRTHFVYDETLTKSLGLSEHMSKADYYRQMLIEAVKTRLTLAAFTTLPGGKRQLVGANPLYVMGKGDKLPEDKAKDEVWRRAMRMFTQVGERVDVHKIYGEDLYTSAYGLSVAREFRGHGVGVELLKARLQLTSAVGINLSVNFFTGAAGQIQAERAGYEIVTMGRYKDLIDHDGSELFPNVDWPVYHYRAHLITNEDGDFK